MTLLVVGLILFFAVHLLRVFAPGFRTGVIARFGKRRITALGLVMIAMAGRNAWLRGVRSPAEMTPDPSLELGREEQRITE